MTFVIEFLDATYTAVEYLKVLDTWIKNATILIVTVDGLKNVDKKKYEDFLEKVKVIKNEVSDDWLSKHVIFVR